MDRPPTLDTRGRILRTALDLFAAHGYQRTSLRQIADRLELTKAGVLYHFPSKEHLLVALAEPLLSDLETALERAARLPWPAARWAALEGWLDTLLTHRRPLGTLYHDMTLLARGSTYSRIMRLALQAYELVAGPDATRLERIRAVQATAMLGDPIVFFTDVPDDQLRADMLDGVARLLGEALPDADATTAGSRPEPATPAGTSADGMGAGDPVRVARSGWTTGATGTTDPTTATAPTGTTEQSRTPIGAIRPAWVGAPAGIADPAGIAADRFGAAPPGSGRRAAGRPRALAAEQVRTARAMHTSGSHTVDEIAAYLGVSRATVYRHLRTAGPVQSDIDETVSETN